MRVPLSLFLGVVGAACTCGGGGGGNRNDDGGCGSNTQESSAGCGADFASDGSADGWSWGYGGYGYGGSGGYWGQGGLADAGCTEDGEAGCHCEFGHDNCNPLSKECETSLKADPANCGICGHSCDASRSCSYGSCSEVVLVASSNADVTAMARDESALYYAVAAPPRIYFVPDAAQTATKLLTLPAPVQALEISGNRLMTLGGGDFDVAVYDFSLPVPLAGGFTLDGQAEALAIDSTYVYASASAVLDPDASVETYEGSVLRAPIFASDAGSAELLFSESGRARALSVGGSTLYVAFSMPGRIYAIATDTLAVSLVTSGDFDPSRIALNGGFVYFADQSSHAISRASVSGGPVETVVATSSTPFDVHIEGDAVWFTLAEPGALQLFASQQSTWVAGLLRASTPILVTAAGVYYSVPSVGVVRLLE